MLGTEEKIFVAGHRGLVGSAIIRKLIDDGVPREKIITRSHKELDLTNQALVTEFFEQERPEYVILAAAKVGGILANNNYAADFIYQNLMIEANVIHQACHSEVKRLLFLGSSCIYPKLAKQPMAESALLTGELEPTNEPYALAKISGIKLCESYNRQYGTDFRSVMPTNLYGENDNFNLNNSHVIPALIRKVHEAKIHNQPVVEVWGSGNAKREFLHVDDMADASLHVLGLEKGVYENNTEPMLSHINVGTGVDVSIRELAETIVTVVGYDGSLVFDTSKPDGAPRKLLDVSRLHGLGWSAKYSLHEGLGMTYQWYLDNRDEIRQ